MIARRRITVLLTGMFFGVVTVPFLCAQEISAPPSELKTPEFYTKYISATGYPIVASAGVNDYALKEAAFLINMLLAKRPDVRDAMIQSGSRMCIIGAHEFTTDLPEWKWMAAQSEDNKQAEGISAKNYWDARARGMGGSQTDAEASF